MKIVGIYKITNPIGQMYIGQSVNILNRFSHYKCGHCHSQKLIFDSIVRFGWDNHVSEIIKYCEKSELNFWESFYIKEYATLNTYLGLNLSSGGSKRKVSEATKIRMSISLKNTYTNGRKPVAHFLVKGSKNPKSKSVLQYTLNGLFIKEWGCISDAARSLGGNKTAISSALKGAAKSAYGFVWKFKEEKNELSLSESISSICHGKLKKPICQYDKKMNFIRYWDCSTRVEQTLLINRHGVANCCKNNQKTAGGFIWKYFQAA